MRKTILGLLLGLGLFAQSPNPPAGIIVVNTTITATGGTLKCTINPLNAAVAGAPFTQISMNCSDGTPQVFFGIATPQVGAGTGVTMAINSPGGNAVTAIISQPVAGTINWAVSANGVTKNGNF